MNDFEGFLWAFWLLGDGGRDVMSLIDTTNRVVDGGGGFYVMMEREDVEEKVGEQKGWMDGWMNEWRDGGVLVRKQQLSFVGFLFICCEKNVISPVRFPLLFLAALRQSLCREAPCLSYCFIGWEKWSVVY